jgi:hypothetical protein
MTPKLGIGIGFAPLLWEAKTNPKKRAWARVARFVGRKRPNGSPSSAERKRWSGSVRPSGARKSVGAENESRKLSRKATWA